MSNIEYARPLHASAADAPTPPTPTSVDGAALRVEPSLGDLSFAEQCARAGPALGYAALVGAALAALALALRLYSHYRRVVVRDTTPLALDRRSLLAAQRARAYK